MIENQSVAPDCPLRHTARITLVLSNLCPYRHLHAKCPASRVRRPQILPGRVVEDVLRTAAGWGWGETGVLAWHMYNEPTADPRLLHFCWMAKAMMPEVEIHLWTNGWYLDHGMATELSRVGVSKLVVSTYGRREFARLRPLRRSLRRLPTTVKVWRQTLERLTSAGMKHAELPAWYDVDRPDDLTRLRAELATAGNREPELLRLRNAVDQILSQPT